MLYMTAGDKKIVILESANLEELKKGRPATTPDGSVFIAWTPDPVWLADQILGSGGDGESVAKAIAASLKRPEKPGPRKYHKPYTKDFRE